MCSAYDQRARVPATGLPAADRFDRFAKLASAYLEAT